MTHLDHVALVVPRLEPATSGLTGPGIPMGPVEEFPAEGTREIYIGEGSAKLLLLQPLSKKGPYAKALGKRGPGLHHIALHTPQLDEFLGRVRGWLMHPKSLETMARSRTAWMARPGVPVLIEVQETDSEAAPPENPWVESIEIPGELDELTPKAGLSRSPDQETWLTIRGRRLSARRVAQGDID